MEQFAFNFEEAEPTDEEVKAEYKNKVGIDPTFRGISISEMKAALTDPGAERVRLLELDRESDQEDIHSTYRR